MDERRVSELIYLLTMVIAIGFLLVGVIGAIGCKATHKFPAGFSSPTADATLICTEGDDSVTLKDCRLGAGHSLDEAVNLVKLEEIEKEAKLEHQVEQLEDALARRPHECDSYKASLTRERF